MKTSRLFILIIFIYYLPLRADLDTDKTIATAARLAWSGILSHNSSHWMPAERRLEALRWINYINSNSSDVNAYMSQILDDRNFKYQFYIDFSILPLLKYTEAKDPEGALQLALKYRTMLNEEMVERREQSQIPVEYLIQPLNTKEDYEKLPKEWKEDKNLYDKIMNNAILPYKCIAEKLTFIDSYIARRESGGGSGFEVPLYGNSGKNADAVDAYIKNNTNTHRDKQSPCNENNRIYLTLIIIVFSFFICLFIFYIFKKERRRKRAEKDKAKDPRGHTKSRDNI